MLWCWARNRNRPMTGRFEWQNTTTAANTTQFDLRSCCSISGAPKKVNRRVHNFLISPNTDRFYRAMRGVAIVNRSSVRLSVCSWRWYVPWSSSYRPICWTISKNSNLVQGVAYTPKFGWNRCGRCFSRKPAMRSYCPLLSHTYLLYLIQYSKHYNLSTENIKQHQLSEYSKPRVRDRICCRISSSCSSDGSEPILSHMNV